MLRLGGLLLVQISPNLAASLGKIRRDWPKIWGEDQAILGKIWTNNRPVRDTQRAYILHTVFNENNLL